MNPDAYPKIKCLSPAGTTREAILAALYDCNATCRNCKTPFVDGDACTWGLNNTTIVHLDCDAPDYVPQGG